MTTQQENVGARLDEVDSTLGSIATQLLAIDTALVHARDGVATARRAVFDIPSVTGFPPFEPIVLAGDGRSDVTLDLNNALAKPGAYRYIPEGEYLIDPLKSILPRHGQTVAVSPRAIFRAIPHDKRTSYVLHLDELRDVVWIGGVIVGERRRHTYAVLSGTLGTHEWNHGLKITKGRNCIVRDLAISECAGDGASVAGNDILLDGVSCTGNRRNAITLGGSKRARILNCYGGRTGKMTLDDGTVQEGAANGPWAGIDIEPDSTSVEDALIAGCTLDDNQSSGIVGLIRSGLTLDLEFTVAGCVIRGNSNGIETKSQDGTRSIAFVATGNVFDKVRAQGMRLEAGTRATIGGAPGSVERNTFIARTDRPDKEITGIPTTAPYTNDISKRTGAEATVLTNLYK